MDTEKKLILEIIDEAIEERTTQPEGFIINTDEKAEWALKKLSEERSENQRYINVCQSMIVEYEEKIRKAEEKLKNKTSYLEGLLHQFFESLNPRTSKTQEIYRLLSGTLRLKYQQPEFIRDDELLLKWLKENKMNDYVKIEEKPNWAELKKKIIISDEKVLSEEGQIVEGIDVVERPPVFEVEI
jgi:hypothetical protein